MGNIFQALKRGIGAATSGTGPSRFEVAGLPVNCTHCRSDRFALGSAQLNTAGMTFLGLDWANPSASTLMCANCGRIEWFGQEPAPVE